MTRWLFTCEHGGNRVPAKWRHLFVGADAVLQSHRGWDEGALCVYRIAKRQLADYAHASQTTRLLVDLNRSAHHRALFSEFTRPLSAAQRELIFRQHYMPWREAVIEKIKRWRDRGETVLHISFHSFTPALNGKRRNAEIGLLYDPARSLERHFCRRWQQQLETLAPDTRVRRNYPYRGVADGFTTALRRRYASGYAGIELELNAARVYPDCAAVAGLIEASLLPFRSRQALPG